MDRNHFEVFTSIYERPPIFAREDPGDGKNPRAWYAGVPQARPQFDWTIPEGLLNRAQLIAMQPRDSRVCTLELCVAILAWGGMHGSNRNHLFSRPVENWLNIAECVRNGHLTRSEAFDAFAALARLKPNDNGAIVGMGPAYFTKLIYFLMPRNNPSNPIGPIGYIMDQWLGCSVNLLAGNEIVKMDHAIKWEMKRNNHTRSIQSTVSNFNSGKDYEAFCGVIEDIANKMGAGWTSDSVEMALMSRGKPNRGPWRSYVMDQRFNQLIHQPLR